MKVYLQYHDHKYFPYEKTLAREEATLLTQGTITEENEHGIIIECNNTSQLEKLVYFSHYNVDIDTYQTIQSKFESSCTSSGKKKKQSTRYASHGLHEYKGKFNPQIAAALTNILRLNENSVVLDPFGGSGTTLVECALRSITAYSTDINPLANTIANAKVSALAITSDTLQEAADRVRSNALGSRQNVSHKLPEESLLYLEKWFEEDKLKEILKLKSAILQEQKDVANILLCIASDLLREHSLQDPGDLRVRRRKTPTCQRNIIDDFEQLVSKFKTTLSQFQEVCPPFVSTNRSFLSDSRDPLPNGWPSELTSGRFDAFITSPPYATALPYIDSQRLSLVWLGLLQSSELQELESELIGSREFRGKNKRDNHTKIRSNTLDLPPDLSAYCLLLADKVGETDGFRRKAVPHLLYRYLAGMRDVFRNCYELGKKGAQFALVVGSNSTTLGGEKINIDTPSLLVSLAGSEGWGLERHQLLETYHRYGIHQANSIRNESLIILRK